MKYIRFLGAAECNDRPSRFRSAFTLIELLVVIAIIAILAVVVVLVLNPSQLLAQSRDANRVSDMATLGSALNLYQTDLSGTPSYSLGTSSLAYVSISDSSSTCGDLDLPALGAGQSWNCASSATYRATNGTGWLPVNFSQISAGAPFGSLPVDPVNQTSSGLFYSYGMSGSQYEATADFESSKYKQNYANNPQTSLFPEIISAGVPSISLLYNPSGLVGYWPLNEGSGTVALEGINGNNGAWIGTAVGQNGTYYIGGKVGSYAGAFDGATTYISVPAISAYNVTNSVSVCVWIYPNNTSVAQRAITKGFGGGASNSLWYLYINGGHIYFAVNDTGYGDSGTPAINANTWTFACGVYDGAYRRIYLNGSQQFSVAYNTPINTNNLPIYIGSGYSGQLFNGWEDDIRVYGRALSPAEIMALYDAER